MGRYLGIPVGDAVAQPRPMGCFKGATVLFHSLLFTCDP